MPIQITPHIDQLMRHQAANLDQGFRRTRTVWLLDTGLDVVYRAGTCANGCSGTDHRIERMGIRVYNHAASALLLIRAGCYDEAMSLLRSIGEIVNLLALFFTRPEHFDEWVGSSRSERLKKYSPARVRELIENTEELPVPVDREWYRRLCEQAVHITPETVPNPHEEDGRGVGGGRLQLSSEADALDQLALVTLWAAVLVAKMAGGPGLFERASIAFKNYDPDYGEAAAQQSVEPDVE